MESEQNGDSTGRTRRDALRALGVAGVGGIGATMATGEATGVETTGTVPDSQEGGPLPSVEKLLASDGEPDDGFGAQTAMDRTGDTLLVTAPEADTETETAAGAAYVYRRVGTTPAGEGTGTPEIEQSDPDLDDAVRPAAGDTTVYLGQRIVVSVDDDPAVEEGDIVGLVEPEDEGSLLLANATVEDGGAAMETADVGGLTPGPGYRLVVTGSEGNTLVAEFQVVEQAYAVSPDSVTVENVEGGASAEVTVSSQNRIGHTHVVTSPDLSATELQGVLGGVGEIGDVDGDGTPELYVTGGTTQDEFTLSFTGRAAGEYGIEFGVFDTTATDGLTVEVRRGGEFYQEAELVSGANESNEFFGSGCALSADGTTLAVGADGSDAGGQSAGSVYVFERDDGWNRTARLVADDGDERDRFGSSVALSADGSTVVVGALNDEDPNGSDGTGLSGGGSAYAFQRDGSGWTQTAKLAADDGPADSWFGFTVDTASTGDLAAVGAPREDTQAGRVAGAAYLFESTDGGWTQVQRLVAPDGAPEDVFGTGLALSADGSTVVVGAYNDDSGGTVYAFERGGGGWSLDETLSGADTEPDDSFGYSVALSDDGDTAVVGALGDENPNGPGAGAAYLFESTDGGWQQARKVAAPSGSQGGSFGTAVSLSADGSVSLVGADGESDSNDRDTGAAYVVGRSDSLGDRFDDGNGEVDPQEVLAVIEAYNDGDDAVGVQDVLAAIEAYNEDAGWDALDD